MTLQARGLVLANSQQVRHIYSSGLSAHARVLTLSGEKPIEDIEAGERLISADVGVTRLRAISKKRMHLRDMIRICPSALWDGEESDAFYVAPNQPIVVRGWMSRAMFGCERSLVSARRLLDGVIYRRPSEHDFQRGTVTLYQLHFDKQHLVRVAGIDMASTKLSSLKPNNEETVGRACKN